jgi:transcription elongation factor Elf1
MPVESVVKPFPRTYHCPACGWSKKTAPKSDALEPGDYFRSCPKCGNENLEISCPLGEAFENRDRSIWDKIKFYMMMSSRWK